MKPTRNHIKINSPKVTSIQQWEPLFKHQEILVQSPWTPVLCHLENLLPWIANLSVSEIVEVRSSIVRTVRFWLLLEDLQDICSVNLVAVENFWSHGTLACWIWHVSANDPTGQRQDEEPQDSHRWLFFVACFWLPKDPPSTKSDFFGDWTWGPTEWLRYRNTAWNTDGLMAFGREPRSNRASAFKYSSMVWTRS